MRELAAAGTDETWEVDNYMLTDPELGGDDKIYGGSYGTAG